MPNIMGVGAQLAMPGQVDARVKFLSRGRGYGLSLTSREAGLELQRTSVVRRPLSVVRTRTLGARSDRDTAMFGGDPTKDQGPRTADVLRLRLVNANQNAVATGVHGLPGRVNYFVGKDPKKWRTNVPTYAQVRYHNVCLGVDLEYYDNRGGQLEYDFIVAPGADSSAIALDVGAVREPSLRFDRDGDRRHVLHPHPHDSTHPHGELRSAWSPPWFIAIPLQS